MLFPTSIALRLEKTYAILLLTTGVAVTLGILLVRKLGPTLMTRLAQWLLQLVRDLPDTPDTMTIGWFGRFHLFCSRRGRFGEILGRNRPRLPGFFFFIDQRVGNNRIHLGQSISISSTRMIEHDAHFTVLTRSLVEIHGGENDPCLIDVTLGMEMLHEPQCQGGDSQKLLTLRMFEIFFAADHCNGHTTTRRIA